MAVDTGTSFITGPSSSLAVLMAAIGATLVEGKVVSKLHSYLILFSGGGQRKAGQKAIIWKASEQAPLELLVFCSCENLLKEK